MKKALFLFFSVLLILFVSCENFMNGSDVQDELTKMIDVANAKDYTIIVAQNEAMGSFLSYGDKNCKIGYSIDLQFTVDSENYIYKGLKVVSKDNPENSREDCVELTEVSTAAEKKNGIHKVQVKLIKEANDIMIQPDCILIPKIVNITPVNMPTSYDQDTPIEITFNKSLDSESFGNYSCISIYSNEIDLKEYFEEPSFSTNNTKLLIVPKQDRHIITPDSGKIMTVTVELNFKNEKDTDGMLLNDNKIYTYKINETFGNQEISTILVREDEDSKSGKFDKTGEIKCTVGYSFDLQFTLKKAAYVFNGLEAVSKTNAETFNPDIVEFETIKSDDDLGIYTIQVKIKEQSNDILIKPKCILIPKITKITPDYITSGCYQDETITIEFNKSVDPESFGDFECISISSGDEELTTAYFDTPAFFDEYKLLKISPKAKLLPPDSNKRKDINIRIDFTNLKDVDGLSIESYPAYSYRINDNFNNQEISEISVETDANNSTGTFDKSGQIKCTVGYDVNLQFKVNKSLYVFKGLKVDRRNTSQAYNPDDVSITYKGDESTGIYDITVHMNKKTENIKLSPDCKLIPRVTQITPNYSSTGCEQDSTIEITFNKAVDRTSFGSFDCIDIYSDGDDIKSEYFNTPVFNDENTVLKITPKKLIIQPDSGKKKDINVRIDFTDLKDCDGLSIEYYPTYSYRINDTFNNQKKSKILIQNPTNTAEGSFDKTGEIECSVGYDINLQFKLNKADYIFEGLNIERRNTTQTFNVNAVTITSNGDSDTGIYTIAVHVNQETENIKISPNCKLIPRVTQITPAYVSNGCEQDEAIEIKFNKAVDATSFGDFSCIDIYSEGDDLKTEYFNTPVFYDENTVLKITSKKLILQPDSGKKKDINVKIDFTNLKDCDGLSIEPFAAYSFRINDSFEGQEKSKILIKEDTNSITGTFDRTGEIECTVGYDINLQFNANKADYVFRGLKVESRTSSKPFNSNDVEIVSITGDKNTGLYTIIVHVNAKTDNIQLSPDCVLLPKVSSVTPSYESTGCEQDSTITVTFNKPIEITEFFSPTITDSSGNNLAEYFDKPYLSDESDILYIPTIKTKRLINTNGSSETKDIILKLDLSNIKDEDNNTGSGIYQHKYRVNKTLDSVKPVLTSVNLYSSPAKNKQLTAKAFESWNSTGTGYGDFGTNHIKDSVYIETAGYDIDSGIAAFVVKEKIIKYSDAQTVNYDAITTHIPCTKNATNQKYYSEYTIDTAYDGIVELEFYVEDYAGNISEESKKFYVLKDTMVDTINIRFIHEKPQDAIPQGNTESAKQDRAARLANIPLVTGDEQTVTLTIDQSMSSLKKRAQDYFYDSFYTPYDIEVYWGYSEDTATNKLTKDSNNNYTFTRDVSKFAFIKLVCKDNVGNEKIKIKRMAPRAEVCEGERQGEQLQISITNKNALIIQSGISLSQNLEFPNCAALVCEFEDKSVTPNKILWRGEAAPQSCLYQICNSTFAAGQYPTGNVKIYVASAIGDFYSPMSLNYVSTSITGWNNGEAEATTPSISSQTDAGKAVVNSYGPEGTDYISRTPLKITTTPIQNTGCTKAVIENYSTPAGEAAGVTYSFYVLGWYPKGTYSSVAMETSSLNKSPEILLYTGYGYKIFVEAYDSQTRTIYRPFNYDFDSLINWEDGGTLNTNTESFDFYLDSSTTTTRDIKVSKDLAPPYIMEKQNLRTQIGSPGGFMINGPNDYFIDYFSEDYNQDNTTSEQTLPLNENGNYELNYYIIPNPSSNIDYVPSYSIKELRTDYKGFGKTLEYKLDALPDIIIPYGNLAEGFYTISIIAEDISGNAEVYTYPFVNYTLGKLPYTMKHTENLQNLPDGSATCQTYLKFSIDQNKRSEYTTIVNGEDKANIFVDLSVFNGQEWSYPSENILYTHETPEDGQGEPTEVLTFEKAVEYIDNYPNEYQQYTNPWRKLTAYTGFSEDNTSAVGTGYFNTEYLFLGSWRTCNIKNCMEGLNGIQIFGDNDIFVHTMFSPDKLTDSKYTKDALSIWETKGAETGVEFYHTESSGGATTNINKSYDLSKLDGVPIGCWYTTIIRFADGTVVMTDIKQKY